MPDLRSLPIETRRQLAVEAERRARAGETPTKIAAALGLSLTTYGRWAALYGFRLSDIDPENKQGRGQHEAGTASGMSGRFMLRQGLGGRVKGSGRPAGIDLEAEGLLTTRAILNAVRDALQANDRSRADRLIAAWKVKARRTRDLATLEAEAAEEFSTGQGEPISDEDLVADISALLGRPVKLRG
ncbi:MAG: hypothetical protein Hens2KO_04020 [Henriciella sp.]